MLIYHLKIWAALGTAAILGLVFFCSLALADETETAIADYPLLQRPSGTFLNTGFFLKFSQMYYQSIETSLQEKPYFAFRYYLASPFESFDKREFISENPTQASDLAMRALHNVIRQTVDNIEVLEILRGYEHRLTNLQMVIGAEGTRIHGPLLTEPRIQDPALQTNPNYKMTLSGGLTFAEDFKSGLMLAMVYHRIISKLTYYPTSGNEMVYTAETQLTSSTKVALSYHSSQDNSAVLTTLSFKF